MTKKFRIKDLILTRICRTGIEPTWIDVNDIPADMTKDDIAYYKNKYNIVFFDSKKGNKTTAGFKINDNQ